MVLFSSDAAKPSQNDVNQLSLPIFLSSLSKQVGGRGGGRVGTPGGGSSTQCGWSVFVSSVQSSNRPKSKGHTPCLGFVGPLACHAGPRVHEEPHGVGGVAGEEVEERRVKVRVPAPLPREEDGAGGSAADWPGAGGCVTVPFAVHPPPPGHHMLQKEGGGGGGQRTGGAMI